MNQNNNDDFYSDWINSPQSDSNDAKPSGEDNSADKNMEQASSQIDKNNESVNNMEQVENNNVIEQKQNNQNVENSSQNDLNDNILLRSYIGEKYDEIVNKPFNIFGFLFTPAYLFYRKMFWWGILVFLIELFVLNVLKIYYIVLAFNLLIGFGVNKLYVFLAQKRINKIKDKYTNQNIDQLKQICSKKGGTSVIKVIIGILTEIIMTILILLMLIIIGFAPEIKKMFKTIKDTENKTNGNNAKYEGILSFNTEIKMNEQYIITVPAKFENNSEDYSYVYNYHSQKGVFDSCSFSLNQVEGYSDSSNLITQMKDYYKDNNPAEITDKQINNILWQNFYLTNDFGTTYYYGTTKDNKVYLLSYEINKDAADDCLSYLEPLINSIKQK